MKHNLNYSDLDKELSKTEAQESEIQSSESRPNFYITRGIKDIICLFFLNKKLTLSIFVTIVCSTAIYQHLITPRYQTSMLLELTKAETQNMPQLNFTNNYNDKDVRIGNLLTLMKSSFIMGDVFEEIKTKKQSDFDLEKMSPQIDIVSLPNTDLLRMVVSDTNNIRAKYFADSIISTYFKQNAKKASMMHAQGLQILSERIGQSKSKIHDLEQKITEFHREDKNFSFLKPSGRSGITSNHVDSIIDLISKNEVSLIVIYSKSRTLQKLLKSGDILSAIYSGFSTPKIKKLFDELLDLETEKIALSQNFKNMHPEIQQNISQQNRLKGSIKSALNELVDSYKNEILSLKKNNLNLTNELIGLKSQVISQNTKHSGLMKLENELEISKKINHQLLLRQRELELADSVSEQEFIVIEEALVPKDYYYPRRLRNILFSVIVALTIVFIIIIISDFFAPKIVSTNDVEKFSRIPVLKVISKLKKTDKILHNGALMVFKDLKGHGAEAFRHLRSKIEFRLKRGSKSLLITSPNESDGKTFISINLAMSFSIKKKKVLLVDADLRKSTLSRIFRNLNPKNVGLSDVLRKKIDYSECVVKTLIHGLDIMFAGERVAYPAELLESDIFINEFLNKAKKEYDLIIIDSPKAYLLSDPMVISGSVENILVVASHGSPINDLYYTSHAIKEEEGNIIGCILNKVQMGPGHQSSYYYYY